jgi:multidrug transporter EmrE-like cation transporter
MKSKDFIDKMINSIQWDINGFNVRPIFFGCMMALVDIVMMSTTKMVSQGTIPSWWGTPLAIGIYALEPLIFLKALNYEGMVVTNLVWNLSSNIIVTLQGVFIFGETIKGLRWVGIAMSLVSLALLAYTSD